MIIILTITDDNGENAFTVSAKSIESLEGEIGRFQRFFEQRIIESDKLITKNNIL